MVEIIGLIIFGLGVGAYGTLVGIGGGPLIVPFLLICYDFEPEVIVATSLCVVFFNVISGSIAYARQGRIDIITGTKFGLATIPGALLGTLIPGFFTHQVLGIIFGLLILILAIYIITDPDIHSSKSVPLYKDSAKKDDLLSSKLVERTIIDFEGREYVYRFNEKLGIGLSAGIGFIATMLGIGGGVIHVPMLKKILNFPVHIATATAHYKLAICATFGLIPYFCFGWINFKIAVPLGIGAIVGARIGAHFSKRTSGKKIFRLLAVALAILAIRLLFFGL